jgi:hypothetical protein
MTLIFEEKTPFFCGKMAKIAKNNDHNIDPRLTSCVTATRSDFTTCWKTRLKDDES